MYICVVRLIHCMWKIEMAVSWHIRPPGIDKVVEVVTCSCCIKARLLKSESNNGGRQLRRGLKRHRRLEE